MSMRFEDDYQEAKILLLRDLKKLVKYIENNNMKTEHIRKEASITKH